MHLHARTRTLTGPSGACRLSHQEYVIVDVLASADGKTVTRDRLYTELWGLRPPALPAVSLRVGVFAARMKLYEVGYPHATIETVRGVGFRIQKRKATTITRSDQRQSIRDAIRAANPAVRKVWIIPDDICDRIGAYQSERLIPSEVQAALELINEALTRNGF